MKNEDIEKIVYSKEYNAWYKRLVKSSGCTSWDLNTLKIVFPEMFDELENLIKLDK